jgi:hypothetical protein
MWVGGRYYALRMRIVDYNQIYDIIRVSLYAIKRKTYNIIFL